MAVFNIFSRRQRQARGEFPDVFAYDDFPEPLKVQIIHIADATIGRPRNADTFLLPYRAYVSIRDVLRREYGVFRLVERANSPYEEVCNYFLNCTNVELGLDVVELICQSIDQYVRFNGWKPHNVCDDALIEVNDRFREHGFGFQFESGEIIRVDSQLVHSEAVKPALSLLSAKRFANANTEFLKAHEHYRHGRYPEALVDALKSFESVLKVICSDRKWPFNQADAAKAILDVCFKHGLVPTFMQSQFSSLRSLLESGVPVVRNKMGGHGQGAQAITVPEHVARYALNLAASNILFLVECDAALP